MLQGSEVVVIFMVVVLIMVYRVVMVFEVLRVIMVFKVFRVTELLMLVLVAIEEFLFKELVFFEFILMDQEFGMVMCLWQVLQVFIDYYPYYQYYFVFRVNLSLDLC